MEVSALVRNVLWNGMLAVIPVALAYAIVWLWRPWVPRAPRYVLSVGLAAVWLVFLPNTCYLLTEWRHFLFTIDVQDLFIRARSDPYLMAQITGWSVFYLLYSGFGMVTFALAIRPLERLAARRGAAMWHWALPFFVALAVGVYLGLILRLNSWDFLSRPAVVWDSIVQIGGRPRLIAFILGFAVFLWAAYEALDLWVDGIVEWWRRLTGKKLHLGPAARD